MRREYLLASLLFVAVAFWSACGAGGSFSSTAGGNPPSPTSSGTVPVSFSLRDAPPAGVSVVSFEVTLTGAVLQPGNVFLLTNPIDIEIKQLETETAFLNTANVPPGAYNSITVTFSNPELTIVNNSGFALGTCANAAVCELRPPLVQASVSYSAAPFPLTIMANSPLGLLLDFNLNSAIQNNLSVNPSAITFLALPAVQGTGELEEIEDVVGRVTSKDAANNRFTLHTSRGDLTVQVDSNTRFEDFDDAGLANSFSSLQPNQIVEVDLGLMAGGTLLAKKVELQETEPVGEMEGTIVSVDSATQFKMVVVEEVPEAVGVQVGNLVTVQTGSSTNFRIDEDGLSVPSDLRFASSADLLVGQNVQVRPLNTSTGSSGILVQTDRVRLRMSQFTARVRSKNGDNFNVDNLPSLFTGANPAITEIQVRTSSQTEFEGGSGVAALSVGDTVSLRGLLFKTPGIPALLAKKVRKR